MKIVVNTYITPSDKEIKQVVDFVGDESLDHRVVYEIVKLRDKQAREALIKLGWTPPKDAKEDISPPRPQRQAISDDDILSLWRTVRPSAEQNKAMVYQSGPNNEDCPTYELRRLVELAIDCGREREKLQGG
jgi:hypothetical protein